MDRRGRGTAAAFQCFVNAPPLSLHTFGDNTQDLKDVRQTIEGPEKVVPYTHTHKL